MQSTRKLLSALILLFMLTLFSRTAPGQGVPRTTAPQNPLSLDRLKPEDFERIDIFTGQLRLNFLLHTVTGRGASDVPIVLRSKGRWAPYLQLENADYDPSVQIMYLHHGFGDEEQVTTSGPYGTIRYVGGMMSVRLETIPTGSIVGAFPFQGGCNGCSTNPGSPPALQFKNGVTLTTLSYTAPDGTIYEFRDSLTGGKPLQPLGTCGAAGPSRGSEFISADGSGAIFISDAEIKDPGFHTGLNVYAEQGYTWNEVLQFTEPRPALNGYVKFRDGTVARIENWRTVWLRDSNGNKTTFHYDPNIKTGVDIGTISTGFPFGRVVKIVDSLGRETNFSYELNDPTYGLHDRITYNGFGGQTKELRITQKPLAEALRSDQSLSTLLGIYGEMIWWEQAQQMFNPLVPTTIWMPDGRQHKILYNNYAEAARIELATGGAVEYEHAYGVPQGDPEGTAHKSNPYLYRRVIEKRVYANGGTGSSWTSKMTLSQSTGINNGKEQYVDLTVFDKNGGGSEFASSKERHFFYGQAGRSYASRTMYFPAWKLGREYKTEIINPSTGSVLRRQENTWQQGSTIAWWYSTPLVYAKWIDTGDPVSYLEPVGHPATNCGMSVSTGSYDPLWNASADDEPAFNVRITEIKTTIEPSSANLVSKQTFSYDQFHNTTDVYDYDFGAGTPGSLLRRTHTDYVTSSTYTDPYSGPYLRSLPSQRWVSSDINGVNRLALTVFEYDNYANDARHKPLVARSGITGHDVGYGTSLTTRGNVTGSTSYINAVAQTGPVTTSPQYDIAGNVVATVDGNVKTTTITFSDAFCNGTSCGGSFTANTYAFAASTTSPVPDPSGQFGSSTALVSSSVYDFWSGQVTASTDANNNTTTFEYNDPLDRLKAIVRPAGGGRTDIQYGDTAGSIFVRTLADLDATRRTDSYEYFDGLGRTIETRRYEGGTNFIATKREYDSSGRVRRSSNPYRPWQSETLVWTTTAYDALGRVASVTTPDNASVVTTYSGNQSIASDQNQPTPRKVKLVTDALDRVRQVYEDPDSLNYLTSYDYDALGNLTNVTQGTQTRTSVYDSLGRLTSTTNPENGTVTFTYDNNGNLLTRTDARVPAVTITYSYDALNRITTINYSDTAISPDITRVYDGAVKGKGELWSSYAGGNLSSGTDVEQTVIDSYDALGRALVQRQLFKLNGVWSSAYQTSQAYNLAGDVTTQTYPSGRTLSHNYDAAGRLADKDASNLALTGNLGDGVSRTYSRGITYSVFGGIAQEQFGTTTPIYNKLFYNSRGQLAEIRAGLTPNDTSWQRGAILNHYSAQCSGMCGGPNSTQSMTDNNGNLKSQVVYVPDNDQASQHVQFTSSFTYDSLNRLLYVNGQRWASATSVTDNLWKQTYIYDRFGNRRIDTNVANTFGAGVNNKNFTVDTNTNRLGVPGGQPGLMTYDNTGNLVTDTYTGGGSRTYDAENRMRTAVGGSGQTQVYTYNADGHRTRRKIDNVELWQIYGIDGDLLAEYAASAAVTTPLKEYGYRNGQLLVTAEPAPTSVQWRVVDHLGTPRMVFNQTGSFATTKRHDYLPFGEEISAYGGRTTAQGYNVGDPTRQSFTQKERDGETGLDYFLARYYSSVQGRFTGVDPSRDSVEIANPQSLNRYSYCLNKPLFFVDPDGEIPLIGNLIGAGTSVAAGYLIAKVTGQEYTWKDAAIDAATGAVGVGVLSKARSLYRLTKLRNIAKGSGMVSQQAQKGMEKYVGTHLAKIEIKHVGNLAKHQSSWIPRARVRAAAGVYIDPFTGAIGVLKSPVGHIPLALLPLTEAPLVGAGLGTLNSAIRTAWGGNTSGGYTDAQRAFFNLRVIGSGPTRVATVSAGDLGTVYVYPDGKKRYVGPLKPRGPGFD